MLLKTCFLVHGSDIWHMLPDWNLLPVICYQMLFSCKASLTPGNISISLTDSQTVSYFYFCQNFQSSDQNLVLQIVSSFLPRSWNFPKRKWPLIKTAFTKCFLSLPRSVKLDKESSNLLLLERDNSCPCIPIGCYSLRTFLLANRNTETTGFPLKRQ